MPTVARVLETVAVGMPRSIDRVVLPGAARDFSPESGLFHGTP